MIIFACDLICHSWSWVSNYSINDPKIDFYRTIKEIESRLSDPEVVLHSFIISQTPLWEINWWKGGMTEEDFEKRHVLFPKAGDYKYIGKIMELILR